MAAACNSPQSTEGLRLGEDFQVCEQAKPMDKMVGGRVRENDNKQTQLRATGEKRQDR
jgi:hypothetical protein